VKETLDKTKDVEQKIRETEQEAYNSLTKVTQKEIEIN